MGVGRLGGLWLGPRQDLSPERGDRAEPGGGVGLECEPALGRYGEIPLTETLDPFKPQFPHLSNGDEDGLNFTGHMRVIKVRVINPQGTWEGAVFLGGVTVVLCVPEKTVTGLL